MPRVNIEDQLFTDGRFMILESKVGKELAMGYYVMALKIAQTFWIPDKKLIPKSIFMTLSYAQDVIDCGLIQEKDKEMLLVGTEETFEWWFSQQKNGKKGGRPSKDLLIEVPKKTENIPPKEVMKKTDRNPTETQPIAKAIPGLTQNNLQSQSQSQSQSQINTNTFPEDLAVSGTDLIISDNRKLRAEEIKIPGFEVHRDHIKREAEFRELELQEKKKTREPRRQDSDHLKDVCRELKGIYVDAFIKRYRTSPILGPKEFTAIKSIVKHAGEAEAREIIKAYLTYMDPYHIRQKHPLTLLMRDLTKVKVELIDPKRMFDEASIRKQMATGLDAMETDGRIKELEARIEKERAEKEKADSIVNKSFLRKI